MLWKIKQRASAVTQIESRERERERPNLFREFFVFVFGRQRIYRMDMIFGRFYQMLRKHKHPLVVDIKVKNGRDELEEGSHNEEIRHKMEEEEKGHTLMSLNEEHMYDGEKFPSCALCEELILGGPCYNCSKHQCTYYLHKSCAEAPETMHHPLHPQHPLTFDLPLFYPLRFTTVVPTYRCEKCNFDLDMKYAFSPIDRKIVNTSIHEHPLISLGREALVFCDACGTKHQGFFYACTTCIEESGASVFIHRNCARLPSTIKYRDHHHHLNLCYSLPTQYSQFYPNCNICNKPLNLNYWIYYCGGCRYFVHVRCATVVTAITSKEVEVGEYPSKQEEEEETSKTEPCTNVIRLPLPDESVSLVRHLIKHMTVEDKKGERITELDHYTHNHPLILHDVQSKYNSCSTSKSPLSSVEILEKNDEICNLCTKPIMNDLFYNCTQCCFPLHEFCAELPAEGRYPGHPKHSLILRAKASTALDWSYCHYCHADASRCQGCHLSPGSRDKCKYCRPISDDYALYCSSCKFYLHLKCGLSPGAITHESHPQHVLFLMEQINLRGSCNACTDYTERVTFECVFCRFQLHILCAYLPQTVKHRYDEHPFTLTYTPLEDHPDEYLCEICEKEINPKYWFYHCVECDQSLHIDCIIT